MKTVSDAEEQIKSILSTIHEAVEEANKYRETIEQQKKEYTEMKVEIEKLRASYSELEDLSRNQLGLVSMETLANSFASEAKKLEQSTSFWFKRVFWSTLVLVVVVAIITIWQVYHEGSLLRWSFAVRFPIALPVIFYLAFVSREYSRDKRLLEEYSYKSSIARSFEAYRKVIKEEVTDFDKKTNFILETVNSIYSSPMVNIVQRKGEREAEKVEDSDIGLLEKSLGTLQKVRDLFIK